MRTIWWSTMVALLVAPCAHAADPMLRPRGPQGERDVIVAEPPAAPPIVRPAGGYVCSVEMIGALPDRPYGAVQFSLAPGRNCDGEEQGETFVAYIATDDVATRSAGSHTAYTEAHAMAMQHGLLMAAREGWRVLVERNPGSAVIKKLTIRMK
jgi:hypothetical protein